MVRRLRLLLVLIFLLYSVLLSIVLSMAFVSVAIPMRYRCLYRFPLVLSFGFVF